MLTRRLSRGRGFVLVGVIWLLVLAGAIVAIVSLRAGVQSREAATSGTLLRDRLALESAVESVMADRLFNGRRSRWWLVPAEGTLELNDRQLRVSLSSESGRIDLNAADLVLINRALQGFGATSAERTEIVSRLRERRAAGERIQSLADIEWLFGGAGGRSCWSDQFTIFSARPQPIDGQVSSELARALGLARSPSPGPLPAGDSLRVQIANGDGRTLTAIVRDGGAAGSPSSVSSWQFAGADCGPGADPAG